MPLEFYVCTNCGFWQQHSSVPSNCPVCSDVRHTLPADGFRFLTPGGAARETDCVWEQTGDGIIAFRNTPPIGIGPRSYLILHPEGNIAFEETGHYSNAALDFIETLGGIRFLSASHPHAYGAFWQLQASFQPEVIIHTADLQWTNSFQVTRPMDDKLELHPGFALYHTSGHFDGHIVLHLEARKILFAGDALKFHLNETPVGISCHKAFNRKIPLSHAEVKRYAEVLGSLDFEETYTTFEHSPRGDRHAALRLFERQLSGRPFFGAIPMEQADVGCQMSVVSKDS